MAKDTWNTATDCNQLADKLRGLTQGDHRSATVDVDGDTWLRCLDKLQAAVMEARHEAARALVDCGY